MSNVNKDIEVGAEVRVIEHKSHQGACGVVTGVSRGWYSVDLNDTEDETIIKVRAASLELWVEGKEPKVMSGTLSEYRKGYVTTHTARGDKSQSSPTSVVAKLMEGKDHAYVAQVAAILMGEEDQLALYMRYRGLNNGQMRMNSGNRINAAVKRGDIIEEDVVEVMEGAVIQTAAELDPIHRPERLMQ